jgi:hypothetical protein
MGQTTQTRGAQTLMPRSLSGLICALSDPNIVTPTGAFAIMLESFPLSHVRTPMLGPQASPPAAFNPGALGTLAGVRGCHVPFRFVLGMLSDVPACRVQSRSVFGTLAGGDACGPRITSECLTYS